MGKGANVYRHIGAHKFLFIYMTFILVVFDLYSKWTSISTDGVVLLQKPSTAQTIRKIVCDSHRQGAFIAFSSRFMICPGRWRCISEADWLIFYYNSDISFRKKEIINFPTELFYCSSSSALYFFFCSPSWLRQWHCHSQGNTHGKVPIRLTYNQTDENPRCLGVWCVKIKVRLCTCGFMCACSFVKSHAKFTIEKYFLSFSFACRLLRGNLGQFQTAVWLCDCGL